MLGNFHSAMHQNADILRNAQHFRFVPEADIGVNLEVGDRPAIVVSIKGAGRRFVTFNFDGRGPCLHQHALMCCVSPTPVGPFPQKPAGGLLGPTLRGIQFATIGRLPTRQSFRTELCGLRKLEENDGEEIDAPNTG